MRKKTNNEELQDHKPASLQFQVIDAQFQVALLLRNGIQKGACFRLAFCERTYFCKDLLYAQESPQFI